MLQFVNVLHNGNLVNMAMHYNMIRMSNITDCMLQYGDMSQHYCMGVFSIEPVPD